MEKATAVSGEVQYMAVRLPGGSLGRWLPAAALAGGLMPAWGSPQLSSLTSAEVCGRCHRDILKAWKSSVHARSMEDPVFQDCLEEAQRQFGEGVQVRCLSCHAPTVAFSGDAGLASKVSWEGVTCDFCHSIAQVDLRSPDHPYRLQIGAAKFGPLRNAVSQGHATSYSPAHTDPTMCGGCHDARNRNGLMVLSSYSEWRESAYGPARGSCVECHMRPVKAQVVDPKVQRLNGATVNLHQMPGGHSVEQLNKAIAGRLAPVRNGDRLEVKLYVKNRGAGHMVPTGSPLRKLVISLELLPENGERLSAQRTYQRAIVDGGGKLLSDETAVWMRGARVAGDNRLKPNEERLETFFFDLPRNQAARLQAHFWYHYSPLESQETGKVMFLTLPALVPAGR